MKCAACGAQLQLVQSDLPFKVSEQTIVILKQLPVWQFRIVRNICSRIACSAVWTRLSRALTVQQSWKSFASRHSAAHHRLTTAWSRRGTPHGSCLAARELSRASRYGNPMQCELTAPVIRYEITLMSVRIAIIASDMVFGGAMLQ